MNKDLMSGASRSLLARVLWEHAFLQSRLIAIKSFLTFMTNYIVTKSDKTLVALVPLKKRDLYTLLYIRFQIFYDYPPYKAFDNLGHSSFLPHATA